MAVALDQRPCSDPHRARAGDPAQVVAPQVHEHHVLGTLLRVGQQLGLEGSILRLVPAPRAGPSDRPHDGAGAFPAHQNLGARSRDLDPGRRAWALGEREIGEIGARIQRPKLAIDLEGRSLRRTLEGPREDHLDALPCQDTLAGLGDGRGQGPRVEPADETGRLRIRHTGRSEGQEWRGHPPARKARLERVQSLGRPPLARRTLSRTQEPVDPQTHHVAQVVEGNAHPGQEKRAEGQLRVQGARALSDGFEGPRQIPAQHPHRRRLDGQGRPRQRRGQRRLETDEGCPLAPLASALGPAEGQAVPVQTEREDRIGQHQRVASPAFPSFHRLQERSGLPRRHQRSQDRDRRVVVGQALPVGALKAHALTSRHGPRRPHRQYTPVMRTKGPRPSESKRASSSSETRVRLQPAPSRRCAPSR